MSKSYGCSHICILGDFNYKEINWISSECTADFNHPANKFLDVVNDNFLTQHVHSPTRFRENETSSLLDLVFTNEEGMIEKISHRHGLGKSDHIILIISFVCYTRKHTTKQNRKNYHKGNYAQIKPQLSTIAWENILSTLDVGKTWQTLADKFINIVDIHTPVSKVRNRPNQQLPFVDKTTRSIIRKKQSTWKKYVYCKSNSNFEK